MARKKPNAKSLANLKPIRTTEEARRRGALGNKARKELKDRKKLLLDDIREVVTAEIAVPKALYESLKELNVPIQRKDTIDKVVFYRALLRAIKEGNADQLLKIAEFAGMKFRDEDEGATPTMTPDTELMLSTLFAQGRKVTPPPTETQAAEEEMASGEAAGASPAEPTITVFSGLG